MNLVILDYATGCVDFRTIPKAIVNDGKAVENYIFGVLGYKESQVSYMFSDDKITINFFNNEETDE